MSRQDRRGHPTNDLVRRLADDVELRTRRRRKRHQRTWNRALKAVLAMIIVTFVIIPTMIAAGFLFGPRGVEGLIAAPLLLLTSWGAILYWAFGYKPRAALRLPAGIDVAQLPARTDEWLEQQRRFLPYAAHSHLDNIGGRLESLSVQLEGMRSDKPAVNELRRLLSEELPELVSGYRRVPRALQHQPLHGGSTPERQLLDGLATIDVQMGRVQEQLAADDMHALATHQRYLDLKYKRDDELK